MIPTVRSDRETNLVHIVYYSSENDPAGELLQLIESRVEPDSYARLAADPLRGKGAYHRPLPRLSSSETPAADYNLNFK